MKTNKFIPLAFLFIFCFSLNVLGQETEIIPDDMGSIDELLCNHLEGQDKEDCLLGLSETSEIENTLLPTEPQEQTVDGEIFCSHIEDESDYAECIENIASSTTLSTSLLEPTLEGDIESTVSEEPSASTTTPEEPTTSDSLLPWWGWVLGIIIFLCVFVGMGFAAFFILNRKKKDSFVKVKPIVRTQPKK